ncbi:hypothetical protein BH23BAC1_BH23BAC1_39060 [soil metagenome]
MITGHSGGNQEDLRMVAYAFMEKFPMIIEIRADPELVKGKFTGDHAGKFEISQLMYIRPDLIDISKLNRQHEDDRLGRFALGENACEASFEFGKEIMEACITETSRMVEMMQKKINKELPVKHISFQQVEAIWKDIIIKKKQWSTYNLHPDQLPAGEHSTWKIYEAPAKQ